MIISRSEFLLRTEIDDETLEVWIGEEWLIPILVDSEPGFSEADLARAQLILELKRDLGVNDEGIGVILYLLDQVHGLRAALAEVLQAARKRG
jgi:chaperone modulatory protein CbpM